MTRYLHGIRFSSIFAMFAACVLGFSQNEEQGPVEQAMIEAAMTLQILEFTEWPGERSVPKRVGVVSSSDSFDAFQTLSKDERYRGRYEVVTITPDTSNEELFQCHALFFSEPDPVEIPKLIRKLEDRPIVLVGALDGFLEKGGLVNLVKRQRRLGFEIELDNSRARGIGYRARLLRLATRIVEE